VDAAIAPQIRTLLQQGVNWATLIQLAAKHRVLSPLGTHLKAVCPDAIPADVLNVLQTHSQQTVRKNLFQAVQLVKLLQRFEDNRIPVIPFKGPTLAIAVYNTLATRPFSDLDLLISPRDLPLAQDLLITEGYQLRGAMGWECQWGHPETRVAVDLHQALAPRFFSLALTFEQLYDRQQSIALAGATVPALSTADLLVILSIQWGKDCCEWRACLAQLCDVAALLHRYPALEWASILQRSRAIGIERMLLLLLLLTRDLLSIKLPEIVSERLLAHPGVNGLADQVNTWLWAESLPKVSGKSFWSLLQTYNHRFYLSLRERLLERSTYCSYWLLSALYHSMIGK
jgi:hypothetical protein